MSDRSYSRPHARWPYPFECVVIAGLVAVVLTWKSPHVEFETVQVAYHLHALQYVAWPAPASPAGSNPFLPAQLLPAERF